jgi:glutamate dehydrogenase (NADP+)
MHTIIERVKEKDPNEKEFHQAVTEVVESVQPALDGPESGLSEAPRFWSDLWSLSGLSFFRVPWVDDQR